MSALDNAVAFASDEIRREGTLLRSVAIAIIGGVATAWAIRRLM